MMKFKKTILLIFVLVLVIGLTGCGNWQSGLDEVENATGPSWDLDLSIPLLPATTVDVGEKIAEELDDYFEIEEDGSFKRSILDEDVRQIFEENVELDFEFNLSEKSFDGIELEVISDGNGEIILDEPIKVEKSISIGIDGIVDTDGFKSLKFTGGAISLEFPEEFIISDDSTKITFAGHELEKIDDKTFSFKDVKIEDEKIDNNEIEVEIEFLVEGVTADYNNDKEYSVSFGDYQDGLVWYIIADSSFIEELDISYSFYDDNIDFSDFDEISEYIKLAASSLEFLIDLSSDIKGLRFKLDGFVFEVDGGKVGVEDFIIESGELNELPEDKAKKIVELLFEGDTKDKKLSIKINGVLPVDENDKFIIYPGKNEITANAELNLYPEFEFIPDDENEDYFIYRAEPTEFELDDDTRDTLSNNLKSVEIVQKIVNELPLIGEIEIFIREDEVDKNSFYDDKNENVYSSNLIRLEKNDQKYRYQEELDEGFIEALIEEGPVYIGFRIKIPLAENSPVRFSINDRIELKMWSNVTVKVNSQN